MILKLIPKYKETKWGGKELIKIFNVNKEKSNFTNIGEAWIASGYEGSESHIESHIDGFEIGLNELYKSNGSLFGHYKSINFPLLIKIIDANEDLSIQVHPNDWQAKWLSHFPNGKLESWYILKANKEHEIIIGTTVNSKKEFKLKVKANKIGEIIKTVTVNNGDVFNIEPGTVHAIKSGTLVYEIQQPSDITYRIYDYNRWDESDNKRELHIKKALKVIKVEENKRPIEKEIYDSKNLKLTQLVENKKFRLLKGIVDGESSYNFKRDNYFLVITVIKGSGKINDQDVKTFESLILTNDELNNSKFDGKMEILITNPI
ncbi:MAG: mannose-6-phosphate isomerase [Mycoplasmataceae bacterium]|nr:mannose-6-phosphate isomerase [Mycoplasmataceae bacterium]